MLLLGRGGGGRGALGGRVHSELLARVGGLAQVQLRVCELCEMERRERGGRRAHLCASAAEAAASASAAQLVHRLREERGEAAAARRRHGRPLARPLLWARARVSCGDARR